MQSKRKLSISEIQKGLTMEPEKAVCPNCSGEETKIGNEITCVKCDAIYVFNKKSEVKVKQIGIAERLDRLEQLITRGTYIHPEPAPASESAPEPEAESGNDEPDAEED